MVTLRFAVALSIQSDHGPEMNEIFQNLDCFLVIIIVKVGVPYQVAD